MSQGCAVQAGSKYLAENTKTVALVVFRNLPGNVLLCDAVGCFESVCVCTHYANIYTGGKLKEKPTSVLVRCWPTTCCQNSFSAP